MRIAVKTLSLLFTAVFLCFAGCVYPPPPPPAPPPPGPGPHPGPGVFLCNVAPDNATRGQMIEIRLNRPHPDVLFFFNGRPIPKDPPGGDVFRVIVPGDAVSGVFEMEVEGRRIACKPKLKVH